MVNLDMNSTVDLPGSLTGKEAVFKSSVLDLTRPATDDQTALSMSNHNGDTILAIGFRRNADKIILNTKKAGDSSSWDTELSYPSLERAFGPTTSSATVTVKDADDKYQIFINGNYLATFAKRYEGAAVKAFYFVNSGQDSMFSNPVTVDIKA